MKSSKLDVLHTQITEIDVTNKLNLFSPKYNFKFEYVKQQESQNDMHQNLEAL